MKRQGKYNTNAFAEISRYLISGLVATAIHFGTLVACLRLIGFSSAGLANLIAAFFGITASFIGSRYFVFRGHTEPIGRQAVKFGALYTSIALLHGLILYIWTDRIGFDYRTGFALATVIQVCATYASNKKLVFKASEKLC